ncbi:MAG: hypothetical protein Q4C70_07865, partial [Planctomycetia bacterium]|nr:hypothetical protein [Planctomycetia bacterium]
MKNKKSSHIIPPPQTAQFNILRTYSGTVICLMVFMAMPLTALSEDYKWTGETGNWFEPTNWTPNMKTEGSAQYPAFTGNPGDTITIESGSVKTDALTIINTKLNVHNGSLNGAHVYLQNSQMEISGGTVDLYRAIYVGKGYNSGSLTISGGMLDVGSILVGDGAAANLDISGNAKVFSSGNFQVGKNGTGTVNIAGSGATIETVTLNTKSGKSNLNFTGDFGIIENGTLKPVFSTIKVGSNTTDADGNSVWVGGVANISGNLSVTMTDYFSHGATYVKGSLDQTLISAGTLEIDENTLKNATITIDNNITTNWNLEQIGHDLILTFDESQFAFADVTSGTGYALGNLGTEGWVTLNGKAGETVDLSIVYSGDGEVEDFVTWLQESMSETQGDVTVKSDGTFVTFEGLNLDEYGKGYLNFDLSAYGGNVSFVDGSNHVPEPATWAMLVIGVGVLV